MVTSKTEGIQLMHIVLRYLDKEAALKMLNDMTFEVASITDNDSLKVSIEMVRGFLE